MALRGLARGLKLPHARRHRLLPGCSNRGLSSSSLTFPEMVSSFPECSSFWAPSPTSKGGSSGTQLAGGGTSGVVYAVLFGKVSCSSTRTATTLLLKAEPAMEARLRGAGSRLQVVVACAPDAPPSASQPVPGQTGHRHTSAAAAAAAADSFRAYVEGLQPHWRAAPVLQAEELRRTLSRQLGGAGGDATGTPQLVFLDSNGRVLVEDGIRHLSLDRAAVGFPWAPEGGAAAAERDGSVRHLVTPLTLARAPQECALTAALLLPPCDTPGAPAFDDQCAILDRYREVAMEVVRDYHMPPGRTTFLYSAEPQIWLAGLSHLEKAGLAHSDLLAEVEACTAGGGGAARGSRPALVVLWSQRAAGGGTAATLAAVPLDAPASGYLSPNFFVHPSLGYERR